MNLKMYEEKRHRVTLAVAAGKGGVGKSLVTVNLALALKAKGFSVGVLDADIFGPSARKMLREEIPPSKEREKWVPAVAYGIRLLSMAHFGEETDAVVVRAPLAHNIILQLLHNVEWGDLDYLLIDFPPGTGDVPLTLAQQAGLTGALMVTTPQELSVADVRKACRLFQRVDVPILGVVENMSGYFHKKTEDIVPIFGQGGGRRLAGEMKIPFLGQIPLDPLLCQYSDTGRSLFSSKEGRATGAANHFLDMAETLQSVIFSPEGQR